MHMAASSDGKVTPIRDTSGQDRPIDPQPQSTQRRNRLIAIGGGAAVLLLIVVLLINSWLSAEISVPLERVRVGEVTRGEFIRDVSAQGTVVAAVSPTLFAAAPGTAHFVVQAGEAVKKDQLLATVDSPELRGSATRRSVSSSRAST